MAAPRYQPRDFIETTDGLLFAVVAGLPEDGRLLCSLRYQRSGRGYRKLDSAAADALLRAEAPEYRYHSPSLDADLHGVPLERIRHHYQPRLRVQALLAEAPGDVLAGKARRWLETMQERGLDPAVVGLTGSLLIGAQTPRSDLDFVIYDRRHFHDSRAWIRESMAAGEFQGLDLPAWRDAYRRRGCALGFEDYLWHERRKYNKGLFEGTKFDITLITEDGPSRSGRARKLGPLRLVTEVTDAERAFDFPAIYGLRHAEIDEAWCFTQTYVGQAEPGDRVEIAGRLELDATGKPRIIVGTSREAPGEYIRRRSPEDD